MLALRLIRRARPAALAPLALVAAASAAVSALLLAALAQAVRQPGEAATVRLLWCVPPLAAVVALAVWTAAGSNSACAAGPSGPGGHHRGSTALGSWRCLSAAALLGSAAALAFRTAPRTGTGGDGLTVIGASGQPAVEGAALPLPAALTLLLVLPAATGCAAALATRSRTIGRPPAPYGPLLLLGCGGAAVTAALVLGTASRAGAALVALGLVAAGPGLTAAAGHLLTRAGPGPARLLAGRALLAEPAVLGAPLGLLTALLWTVAALRQRLDPADVLAPHLQFACAVVLLCALAGLILAARRRTPRRTATEVALHRIGAPAALPRRAALLRAGSLLAVFLPTTAALIALTAQLG
ncbi:hypothetical protein MTQ01_23080 [Streptomyces sp. XM4193]|uniref:hypothetical protein n=1 Tax=Streptomyces sp. XM4193 TaxID=2929782 RepID=UPI001FFAA32A|nr:hypothetical protein [Streptomyces sp. XM4193]MCK1798856.1 hypothetical protein [Streptomyces sp. XM4193]